MAQTRTSDDLQERPQALKDRISELEFQVSKLRSRISHAVVNLSLYRCKRCEHLGMQGWTCPSCGFDDSDLDAVAALKGGE